MHKKIEADRITHSHRGWGFQAKFTRLYKLNQIGTIVTISVFADSWKFWRKLFSTYRNNGLMWFMSWLNHRFIFLQKWRCLKHNCEWHPLLFLDYELHICCLKLKPAILWCLECDNDSYPLYFFMCFLLFCSLQSIVSNFQSYSEHIFRP